MIPPVFDAVQLRPAPDTAGHPAGRKRDLTLEQVTLYDGHRTVHEFTYNICSHKRANPLKRIISDSYTANAYKSTIFHDYALCKYAERARQGSNIILLDKDVADVFKDDKAVNEALRTLIRLNRKKERLAA